VPSFRVQVTIDIDVPGLAEAQEVVGPVGQAAYAAAGEAAVRGEQRTHWRTELTPVDAAAHQAFVDEGLGPGISSGGFSAELP
jgi:hypothetical protein